MNRAVAVVGITLVGLAVGFAVAGALNDEGQREVALVLAMDGGVCKPQDPEKLGGSWVRSKITWHVTNNCTSAQVVAMQNFRKREDGTPSGTTENDLVKPYPPMSQSIGPGASSDVDTHLKKFKLWDTYKYSICAGPDTQNLGTCIDPDVDVWPF